MHGHVQYIRTMCMWEGGNFYRCHPKTMWNTPLVLPHVYLVNCSRATVKCLYIVLLLTHLFRPDLSFLKNFKYYPKITKTNMFLHTVHVLHNTKICSRLNHPPSHTSSSFSQYIRPLVWPIRKLFHNLLQYNLWNVADWLHAIVYCFWNRLKQV